MKISVIGAGFVGLTTACVLASRGINTRIYDVDQKKIESIFAGNVPFFEPKLEDLLRSALRDGKLERHVWKDSSDLVIICVGTPSLSDGSIDTSQVQFAIEECAAQLPKGALVAIKSTVVPGTTRNLQKIVQDKLDLVMIPEFLREGSAVSDAFTPDRNVIGARSKHSGYMVAEILGLSPDDCIFTSTFSAESIKYLSNSFLATCISFTNEIFSGLNEDSDFEVDKIIHGWHSDRRFKQTVNGVSTITSYLTPGPGFGGSCFPKDVRALRANMRASSKKTQVLDGVINANQEVVKDISSWLNSQIPKNEHFVVFGVGFKDHTDDVRESPSISLSYELSNLGKTGYWHDQYVQLVPENFNLHRATDENLVHSKFFLLMHHSEYYRNVLLQIRDKVNTAQELTVFALRYQDPLPGFRWIYPRTMV
jgi:UDPglucose 6-dehydrogenase